MRQPLLLYRARRGKNAKAFLKQSMKKFELHKQYIIEYTICEKGAILREKYKKYTKIVLTIYAGFGNILSTDNTDNHSFKGAMI